jgi:hypothetical protein
MKNLQLKASIVKDTTLNFRVWYSNGTKEAMLMHVTITLERSRKVVILRPKLKPRQPMWSRKKQ